MIYVPEIILKNALDTYINYLAADIAANTSDTTKTFLYKIITLMFGETNAISFENNYDFVIQGLKIFNLPKDDPRYLTIKYAYSMAVNKPPIVCIKLGNQSYGQNQVLGLGAGYLGDDVIQTGTEPNDSETTSYSKSRRMSCSLNLIVMSENSNETLLLYYILQAGIISLLDHLSLMGFENVKISGQDLLLNDELIPKHWYNRVIQLSFEYTTGSLDYPFEQMITDIETQLQNVYEN